MLLTATYSPEDNKLRLYASSRLDAETYKRVRGAGFIWAPKQDLFVAPMWTPERAALLTELCGAIGDEDTSLVDRAEQRAERFEDYSDSRAQDAEQAHKAVERICDGIPLGQPILVGHHSERHARRDAEKIENGMRKAVKMWETSQYWKSRAAGAVRAAKYKELPAVRARRIKGLEADKRSHERDIATSEKFTKFWNVEGLTREQAREIANYDHVCSGMCFPLADFPRNPPVSQYEGAMGLWSALDGIITPEQARTFALAGHARTIAHATVWLHHINNRLDYERAMLAEGGGLAAQGFDIQVGGRVCRRGEWFVVTKLNKQGGVLNSVSVLGHWCSTIQIEEIKDYRAPAEGDAEKVKAVTKQAPLCNYPGDGFLTMTKAEYEATVPKWSDFPKIGRINSTTTIAAHRVRQTRTPGKEYYHHTPVFLSDVKRTDPPVIAAATVKRGELAPIREDPEPPKFNQEVQFTRATDEEIKTALDFDKMRDALRAGVKVVTAPQLFPTPPELAARMVEEADIRPGDDLLEPSAGTGNLLDACFYLNGAGFTGEPKAGRIVAVEINANLAAALRSRFPLTEVLQGDFLECNGNLGTFDAILMNPPFADGQDIKHIEHAMHMLKPGGRLVAICANGPRQQAKLKPLAETWEDLPAGTFKDAGTGVNTALLVIRV